MVQDPRKSRRRSQQRLVDQRPPVQRVQAGFRAHRGAVLGGSDHVRSVDCAFVAVIVNRRQISGACVCGFLQQSIVIRVKTAMAVVRSEQLTTRV